MMRGGVCREVMKATATLLFRRSLDLPLNRGSKVGNSSSELYRKRNKASEWDYGGGREIRTWLLLKSFKSRRHLRAHVRLLHLRLDLASPSSSTDLKSEASRKRHLDLTGAPSTSFRCVSFLSGDRSARNDYCWASSCDLSHGLLSCSKYMQQLLVDIIEGKSFHRRLFLMFIQPWMPWNMLNACEAI